MNKIIRNISGILLGAVLFMGCKKEDGPLSDLKPAVSVTVKNATDFRPSPTVRASMADGKIQIILEIPSGSGRTIKEITSVSASTSYSQVQGTTGLYNLAPIPGSGTTAIFNTTFTEYTAKTGQAISAANTELGRRFYFLLTLDNGTKIIPTDVRVLVVP